MLAGILLTYLIYYLHRCLNINLNSLNEIQNYISTTINALDHSFSYSIKIDYKLMGLILFVFANLSCGLFKSVFYLFQVNRCFLLLYYLTHLSFICGHLVFSSLITALTFFYFIKNNIII